MKYSVITINFNNIVGLKHTILSVLGQTFKDYEYIIIDGGSTDGSVGVIEEYKDAITYWVSEPDNGIYHAMNKGVALAHGDYCIFMNSGDSFFDGMVLKRASSLVQDEDIIVGKLLSNSDGRLLFAPPSREISLYYLYSGTIPHQSTFIKTELLKLYPYDEKLKIVSDWKFFLQSIILHNCSVKFIDVNVARFDLEGISTTNPKAMWMEKESILKEYFPIRLLLDLDYLKRSECLTQTITPQLRSHYRVDRFLYRLGLILIALRVKGWKR